MFRQFEVRAIKTPDAPFLIDPDGTELTYSAALELIKKVAGAYALLGVKPGDRIAVQVEKSPMALLAYLASPFCGAVFLPLNTAYTAGELSYFLEDAAPTLFLCRPEDSERAEQLAQGGGDDDLFVLVRIIGLGGLGHRRCGKRTACHSRQERKFGFHFPLVELTRSLSGSSSGWTMGRDRCNKN